MPESPSLPSGAHPRGRKPPRRRRRRPGSKGLPSAVRRHRLQNRSAGAQHPGPGKPNAVRQPSSGLPSARLFTDLDKISVGDIFTLSVLDRLLSYEVDQILIVLPSEADALAIEAGKDLCTLVTCTPYGVNTHRLLVRGRRIENPEEVKTVRVTADAVQIEPLIVTPVVAAPMLLVLLILLLLQPKKRSTPNGGDTFESK